MIEQLSPEKLNNLYFKIQQAFLFRINKSVASISFTINEKKLMLQVYVLETISESENKELMQVYEELKKSVLMEIQFDILKINEKCTLKKIDALEYKFYLKNEFIQ